MNPYLGSGEKNTLIRGRNQGHIKIGPRMQASMVLVQILNLRTKRGSVSVDGIHALQKLEQLAVG